MASPPATDEEFPYGDPAADDNEIRTGRGDCSWTQMGDWVLLAPGPDRGKVIYGLLRMHLNHGKGDKKAWPSQATLAQMLQVKRTDTVSDGIQWLVEIGAVDIEVVRYGKDRMRARNIYTVHLAPSADYTGIVDHKQWYSARDAGTLPPRPPARYKLRKAAGQPDPGNSGNPDPGVVPGGSTGPGNSGTPEPENSGTPSPPNFRAEPDITREPDLTREPEQALAAAPSLRDGLPTENPGHPAQVVDDQGELAGDVTTRARTRERPREKTPPAPRHSPESYPEPTKADRQLYGVDLHKPCTGHCHAPPGRLCVKSGDTLPLVAADGPHLLRRHSSASSAELAEASPGQTRKPARKRAVATP